MNPLAFLFLFLSLALSSPPPANSLESAIEKAVLRHVAAQQLNSRLEEATLQRRLAEKARLPSAHMGGSARYQTDRIEVEFPTIPGMPFSMPDISGTRFFADMNLGVSLPLLSGGKLQNTIRLGRLAEETGGEQVKLIHAQVAWDVKQLYMTDRLMDAQSAGATALIQNLTLHQQRLSRLYDAGLCSKADLIQSEEKRNESELSRMEIERNRLQLADQFRDLTGCELSGIVLDHLETIPTAEACADLIESHPGLVLKQIEENRSLTQEKLATSDYRPQSAAFAELHGGTPGINMLGDEWSLYGIVGISFRLTLFDFNRKKELLAQGQVQQKQIQFEAKRYKEQLLMRIDMLFRQIEALRQQESGNRKLVELAGQFLAHQERLWQENQASHTDYLTALEHLTQQQSRLDQAHWQIERLKGEINFTLARVKGE